MPARNAEKQNSLRRQTPGIDTEPSVTSCVGNQPNSKAMHSNFTVENVANERQALSNLPLNSSPSICFGGSGSEVAKAKELRRVYLTCEVHPEYCEIIRERLKNNSIKNEHRMTTVMQSRGKCKLQEPVNFDLLE